nr:reverse transcriptase domain-containing protein [Tanacetum cinerariifolium]
MIVAQQVGEGAVELNIEDVSTAGVAAKGAASAVDDEVPAVVDEPSIPSPLPPTQTPPPSQDIPSTSQVQPTLPLSLIAQPPAPEHQPQPSQDADISMDLLQNLLDICTTLTRRRIITDMDADKDVTLKDVVAVAKDVQDAKIEESSDDVDIEPAELQEVVEVVTTGKLITEVVTAASATTTVAVPTLTTAPSAARRRKGVNEAYARELEAELNKNIDWDEVIDHVQRKEKEDNAVKRYQALKRKPQTKAPARKNMMIYLRNVAGFKMDYFKGMTYDDIRPIFEKKFNFNVAFLQKTKEQMDEEDSRALKRLSETQEDKAAKKQKLDEEVPVVDYEIYIENNKPYYKIKRADDSHQIYLSFLSMLRNFNREDLEVLWQLVKERLAFTKPKNFLDDFLLTTLKAMFKKRNIQAQIWKNQRSVHGLAKVKSWKLLESRGVQIITFTTTQLILLVEKKYPLTTFTLDQMLNNIVRRRYALSSNANCKLIGSVGVKGPTDLPFKITCDASDYAVGAVLRQRKTKHFQPIHYASKTMTDARAHYTTTEKELLAVVYAFEKFWPYLVLLKTIVYTEHSTLKYLLTKQDVKLRLLWWILLLQEFDVIIHDKKGAENLAADHLSRLENPHQDELKKKDITETFPLETLGLIAFRGDSSTPWFADIANYHARNFIVKGMSRRVHNQEAVDILTTCHNGPTGGYHGANFTDNPELTIRRRSRTDPTLLNNSEMAAERPGDLPVPDLRTMEELCQPSLNGRCGGTFMKRHPEECYDHVENMTAHHNDWDTSAQCITLNCETCGGPLSFFDFPATISQTQNFMLREPIKNQNKNQGNHNPQGNNQGRNQFFQGSNQGQNQPPAYQASAYPALVYQALFHQPQIPQPQVVTTNEFTNLIKVNDAILKNMQTNMTSLTNLNLELKNMFSQFMKMNTALSSGSGTLPGNTITNPKEDLKSITTRRGTAYPGPTIPITSPSPVVEREADVTKGQVHHANNGSTEDVQPLVVPKESLILNSKPVISLIIEPVASLVSAPRPNQRPSIPYLSRLQDQKLRDKAHDQREKFFQIFKDLNFNISFADALILMPKFGPSIKSLLTNKDKLCELARTPLNEHCSAVLLKKFPKKLGDPSKFLILCDFPEMAEFLALADLGASINLMPLSVWNKLPLPDLSPTYMTLELTDHLISRPVRVADDVYEIFFKTGRALIGLFEGELTLHVGKEAITFNLDQTSRYSANYNAMTANRIDVIDMACEEYSQEILGFSNMISSRNPTPYYDLIISTTSSSLTLFRNSYFLLEEVDAFLALEDDPTLSEVDQSYLDSEGDILLLEAFLNTDPSLPPLNQGNYMPEVRKKLKLVEAKSEKSLIDEPPEDMTFELMCDTSDFAIGAVLGHSQEKHFRPIHYVSKTMTEAESNYTTTKKEMLSVVYAFEKFRSYLIMNKSIVYTDHSALKYLFAKKDFKLRLLRWVLLLQEFTFKVTDTKGAENLAADHLFRVENPHKNVLDPKEINESFLLETLNFFSTRGNSSTPWSRTDPTLLNNSEMAAERPGDLLVLDLRTMEEFCQPSLNGRGGLIAPIAIQTMNLGLKNNMIQQVHNSCQFHGLSGDDANKHLDKFLHVTQSIKVNGVTNDAIHLYLFPQSLTIHATACHKAHKCITNFHQRPDESLFEAWEHYKLSIDRCPNHNMLPVTQIDTFYNGLTSRHRDTIKAAAGGTFMKRSPEECYDPIENMTDHHNNWDTSAQRSESLISITSSSDTEIAAPIAEMVEINTNLIRVLQVNQQVKAVTLNYETCGGPHSFSDFPTTVGQTQNVYVTRAYQGIGRPMRNRDYAAWDGGKGTWGGQATGFGTVSVCVRVQERAGEGVVLLARKVV